MKDATSRIVSALNEAIDTVSVEAESTTGVNTPKQVHQCDDCASFYLVGEKSNESVCPDCGGEGHPMGDVVECGGEGQVSSKDIIDESEEEELKSEAEEVISEALKTLDCNDYRKFNECYRPRVRMTRKGQLQAIVESSNGRFVTASKKMTSRQKTAYNLAEKYVPATATSGNSKKNEAVKLSRQLLMIKNESRAIKIQAVRLLERQNAKYNFKKFNEGMDRFLAGRNIRTMLEDIASDDEIGKSELDQMTPDEIGDAVTSVVKDTGLNVVSNDVDIDGDTATVNVRLEDNNDQEVRTGELESTLGEVFDAPVEIVGPSESEGDSSVVDLAVVINPDDSVNENDEEELDPEKDELNENNLDLDELPRDPEETHKFESYRRRRARRSLRESHRRSMYALMLNESTEDDPKFLAHDDSLVDGYDENSEDKARLFVSEKAAENYLKDEGLEDEYTAKSVTITDEDIDDDVDPSKDLTEEGSDEEFVTDDGEKFSKKDECYFKENVDGDVEEIDESEYEDAKSEYDAEKLKEAYMRRRKK